MFSLRGLQPLASRRLSNSVDPRSCGGCMSRQSPSLTWSWHRAATDHAMQDVRYAARGLRRSPAFAVTVMLTLALGIGANAAMFGVVDRLMFRPVAYLRDPSTVHRVYLQTTARGHVYTTSIFPY